MQVAKVGRSIEQRAYEVEVSSQGNLTGTREKHRSCDNKARGFLNMPICL